MSSTLPFPVHAQQLSIFCCYVQLPLNVLAFTVQLPKGRKEKTGEEVGATGSLNPQMFLHGLATMQKGATKTVSFCLYLLDHKQQLAFRA